MQPLTKASPKNRSKIIDKYLQDSGDEIYSNDTYTVFVRRNIEVPGWISPQTNQAYTVTHLSIKRNDKMAKPDWRDFQWIKNQLVGEENEGIELFPAESRLVDTANQYHLWVFDDPDFTFPFGFFTRLVAEGKNGKSINGETQRKFPLERRPIDLQEGADKIVQYIDSVNKT